MRCSSLEFSEWMAFDKVEPWGNPWEMFALVAAKVHNANFVQKLAVQDLVPGVKPETEPQDVEAALRRGFGV